MTSAGALAPDGRPRPWTSRVSPSTVVHAEEPDEMRPRTEPTSRLALQVVRCDDIDPDGRVRPGDPELVLDTDGPVPMNLPDVDDFIARVLAARARMVAAAPDQPACAGHLAGPERP